MSRLQSLFALGAALLCCTATAPCATVLGSTAPRTATRAGQTRQIYGSTFVSSYTETELDIQEMSITIVFKADAPIPSDEKLNAFLPLDGHRGPFGRRFVASMRTICDALGLKGFDHCITKEGARHYSALGTPTLPKAWGDSVRIVLGLDNRPFAKPQCMQARTAGTQIQAQQGSKHSSEDESSSFNQAWYPYGFFPPQFAEIYGFPRGGAGEGQSIGLVELTLDDPPGNTAGFYPDDVALYFELIGIPLPTIEVVSVDGAQNTPTDFFSGQDAEVCLDIETAGSVAYNATIYVFFAPNTAQGTYDCFATMLSAPYSVDVASCSWGTSEAMNIPFGAAYIESFEELFASVAHQSTILVSSGDGGSASISGFVAGTNEASPASTAQVSFPTSCPHATGVGGSSLLSNSDQTKRVKEVVWNWIAGESASGGGVSAFFDVPDYQSDHGIHFKSINNGRPGRAVPDISANADPEVGYNVRIDGINTTFGGTSASAPLWAGLIARLNYINGGKPLGFINPLLYAHPDLLKKINHGANGQYYANDTYDACTGLGVPTEKIVKLVKHPDCPKEALKPYQYHPKSSLDISAENLSSPLLLLGESYQSPAGAVKMSGYSKRELEDEEVGITIIFNDIVDEKIEQSLSKWAQAHTLAWDGSRGPFARHLTGSAKAICKALGLWGFDHWQLGSKTYRVHASDVVLPEGALWASNVLHIAGLDTTPISHAKAASQKIALHARAGGHDHLSEHSEPPLPFPGAPDNLVGIGFYPFELARIYDFTEKGFGEGQSVGVVELSGGYSDDDLFNYWLYMGIAKAPNVSWFGIDGATNNYAGNFPSNDYIPTTDIEVIGTIAPDCSIQVVFAPDTPSGLYDGIAAAIESGNTIVSTVWGMPEAYWPPSLMRALDRLVRHAAKEGVTVIASTGSHGSSDGIFDGRAHVDFPASSPHVLAVGSTSLYTEQYHNERLFETAWNSGYGLNATGGGVSSVFDVPGYQKENGIKPTSANHGHHKGRGVPDVSSVGDPIQYGIIDLFVDGFAGAIFQPNAYTPGAVFIQPCGTFATSTWAGLIARLKSISDKPLGLLQPELYKHRKEWFHDITKGTNGAYKAKKGYDLTTGLGVPNKHIVELAK